MPENEHQDKPEERNSGTASTEELRASEQAAAEPEKTASQDEGFYTPTEKNQTKKRLSVRAKSGIAGAIFGITVGGFSLSGFFQMAQFPHASNFFQRHHWQSSEDFGDKLSGRFILYALSGKSARGRLGRFADKRADRWEGRLAENGLRSVYSPGTQRGIGYQVIDPVKARPFLEQMRQEGIPTNSRFESGAIDIDRNRINPDITGVDLEGRSFRIRNQVTRSATRTLKVNRIRAALGARLLIKRSGTNGLFHYFRNRVRRSADSFGRYRQRHQDEKRNHLKTGDVDTDVGDTRLGQIRQRFASTLRTARTPATLAIGMVCGAKSLDSSIEEQNLDNQLFLLRTGASAVSQGDQIRSFEDINLAEMGVASEQFYDPETETSWLQDPGVQSERGVEPTGVDYLEEYDLKPGSSSPDVLNILASIPTGVGGVDACDIINEAGEFVEGLPGVGPALGFVNDRVNDSVNGLSGRSLDDWRQWLVDRYANDALTTTARGALWGGMANTGNYMAASVQMQLSGGRPLSDTETAQVKQATQEKNQREFANAGIAERYLNIFDSRSMLANFVANAPTTRAQLASSLTNIASAPSLFGDVLTKTINHKAQAQTSYDYGFPFYGFSIEEQNDERFEDPFEVGDYFYNNPDELERLNEEYGKDCYGMTISANGDLEYEEAGEGENLAEVPAKCSQDVLGANTAKEVLGVQEETLLRYRYHHAYTITAHTLDCFENLSEDSCDQLTGQEEAPPASGPGSAAPGSCPEPSTGNNPEESDPDFDQVIVSVRGIQVHTCIAENLENMLAAAEADGITLTGGGYRSEASQVELRQTNGCPDIYESPASSCRVPTAIPGSSRHNNGTAVDYENMCFPSATCEGNPGYDWLVQNAAEYGFQKLSTEAWHWSVDGS